MAAILGFANWLLPLLYLGLLGEYGSTFFLRTRTRRHNQAVGLVVVLHLLLLVLRALYLDRPPLDRREVISVLALSTALVYWGIETAVRDRRAGLFAFGLVFLLQYMASAGLADGPARPGIASTWGRLHVIPSVMAYTAFAVGAVYGSLHLLAYRNLKKRLFGALFDRLPSVDLLGRMTWYALLAGFALMTVSVVMGPLLLGSLNAEEPGAWDAAVMLKILGGSAAWAIFGLAVLGKTALRWPAPRVSSLEITGFVVTLALAAASALA